MGKKGGGEGKGRLEKVGIFDIGVMGWRAGSFSRPRERVRAFIGKDSGTRMYGVTDGVKRSMWSSIVGYAFCEARRSLLAIAYAPDAYAKD